MVVLLISGVDGCPVLGWVYEFLLCCCLCCYRYLVNSVGMSSFGMCVCGLFICLFLVVF